MTFGESSFTKRHSRGWVTPHPTKDLEGPETEVGALGDISFFGLQITL